MIGNVRIRTEVYDFAHPARKKTPARGSIFCEYIDLKTVIGRIGYKYDFSMPEIVVTLP